MRVCLVGGWGLVRGCVFVCTSSKPILLDCFGGRDRKLEGSNGGFFTFKEKKGGKVTKRMCNVLGQRFPKCGSGNHRMLPKMNHNLTFALILQVRVYV